MITRDGTQASKVENQPIVLPGMTSIDPQQQPAWHDTSKGLEVACLTYIVAHIS